jgi:hypothetical protein
MPGKATVSSGEGSGTRVRSSQLFASNVRWKIVLRVPRAKTSSRRGPRTRPLTEVQHTPERLPVAPFVVGEHLCQSALSLPRAKTSILPSPHYTAAGGAFSTHPSDSQSLQTQFCRSGNICARARSPRRGQRRRPVRSAPTSTPPAPRSARRRATTKSQSARLRWAARPGARRRPASCRNRRRGSFMAISSHRRRQRLHGAAVPTTCRPQLNFRMVACRYRCRRPASRTSALRTQLASERTMSRSARGRLAACCVLAQAGPSARSISGPSGMVL